MYMKHEIKQRQEQVILPEDVYVLGKQLIHVKIEDLLKIDQTARSDAAQQISKHEDLKGFSDGYKENLAKLVMAMKVKFIPYFL